MTQALAGLTGTHTVTTTDDSDEFETLIDTGDYDLGIFFAQGFSASAYADAIDALGAFAAAGGRSIYADWSRNNALVAPFGVSFTGSTNEDQVTVTLPELAAGLATNPFMLQNPGWGVISTGLSGPLVAATFGNGDGAIAYGNDDRSVVYGFLNDTFVDENVGAALFTNQITTLLVPEPQAFALMGGVGLLASRRRASRRE